MLRLKQRLYERMEEAETKLHAVVMLVSDVIHPHETTYIHDTEVRLDHHHGSIVRFARASWRRLSR